MAASGVASWVAMLPVAKGRPASRALHRPVLRRWLQAVARMNALAGPNEKSDVNPNDYQAPQIPEKHVTSRHKFGDRVDKQKAFDVVKANRRPMSRLVRPRDHALACGAEQLPRVKAGRSLPSLSFL